jgi:hypothetical protein
VPPVLASTAPIPLVLPPDGADTVPPNGPPRFGAVELEHAASMTATANKNAELLWIPTQLMVMSIAGTSIALPRRLQSQGSCPCARVAPGDFSPWIVILGAILLSPNRTHKMADNRSLPSDRGPARCCAGGTDLVWGLRVVTRVSYAPVKWHRPHEPGSRIPGVG